MDPAAPNRSALSIEFEAFWRALPKDGPVPHRREFKPERAARFLKDLILARAPSEEDPAMRVRLVGSAIQLRIRRDITGEDYLDFLDPAHRADAIRSAHLILEHPCGLWQIMPLHYERGFAHKVELTMFPLLGSAESPPLLLGLVQPLGELVEPVHLQGKTMHVETASAFQFIDIGAGLPSWPAQPVR